MIMMISYIVGYGGDGGLLHIGFYAPGRIIKEIWAGEAV